MTRSVDSRRFCFDDSSLRFPFNTAQCPEKYNEGKEEKKGIKTFTLGVFADESKKKLFQFSCLSPKNLSK
jgi:hypothetical protein